MLGHGNHCRFNAWVAKACENDFVELKKSQLPKSCTKRSILHSQQSTRHREYIEGTQWQRASTPGGRGSIRWPGISYTADSSFQYDFAGPGGYISHILILCENGAYPDNRDLPFARGQKPRSHWGGRHGEKEEDSPGHGDWAKDQVKILPSTQCAMKMADSVRHAVTDKCCNRTTSPP